MYIWQKAPVDLVRRYGGDPPEDLARDLKEMGRREAAEYLRSRFALSTTPRSGGRLRIRERVCPGPGGSLPAAGCPAGQKLSLIHI